MTASGRAGAGTTATLSAPPGDGRAVLAQPTWEGLRVTEAAEGAIEDTLDALGDEGAPQS